MKGQIKINSTSGLAYIPDDIRNEGFVGEVELLANAKTVTLLLPGADLGEIERSLEIILQDVRLRMGKKESDSQKYK